MMTAMLLFAPLLFATPSPAADAVQLGPPSILTGRKRGYAATEWEVIDTAIAKGEPVAMQCKEFAPSIFSGRAVRADCVLEIVPPQTDAPAIFSGRAPKRGEVIVGARALQYYPAGAVGKNEAEAEEIAQQQAEAAASGVVYQPASALPPAPPKRRAPSIFSGRRAPRAQ